MTPTLPESGLVPGEFEVLTVLNSDRSKGTIHGEAPVIDMTKHLPETAYDTSRGTDYVSHRLFRPVW